MSFRVVSDPWLSEILGRPAFSVTGSGELAPLESPGFYFAKVATDNVADVATLTRSGFVVVDTNVTFELRDLATHDIGEPDIVVGELRDNEVDAVLDIAGSAFRYSRFHLDPQIPDEVAHRIKREWIRNYVLKKRGDVLLVARAGNRPVGFVAALVAHGTAVIDLIAVATDAAGKGAGSALTAAFIQRYPNMPRIVGTQIANVPSIRLYTKLGFVLSRSQYVLHAHR